MSRTAIPPRVLNVTVTVSTYEGDGAYGPVYAADVEVPVAVADGRRLVRTAQGDEQVAESTLYAHPDRADVLAPESTVRLPDGRTGRILQARVHRDLRGREAMVEAVIG